MPKRLFIFAAYDKESIIDETLFYYIKQLSKLGDIIFTMDNDEIDLIALNKIATLPNILSATAKSHGEYDFGSYKRGYNYAKTHRILKNYDFIYLVNDSVFGPLFDLKPILEKMEAENAGNAWGMIGVHNTKKEQYGYPDHVQSWFVGIAGKVCAEQWFNEFMQNIKKQKTKEQIVWKYEIGLSQLLINHNIKIGRFENKICGLKIYNGYIKGLPFIKKLAIHNISKTKDLLKIIPLDLQNALIASITRLELHRSNYKTIWKIKLFNKITLLMMEKNRNSSEKKLWILKLIPIKILHYDD